MAILTAQGEEIKAQKDRAGRAKTVEVRKTVHSDVSRGGKAKRPLCTTFQKTALCDDLIELDGTVLLGPLCCGNK